MTSAQVSSIASRRLASSIKGKARTACRARDIMRGLLIEFPIRNEMDEGLVKYAAGLAVMCEALALQHANGSLRDVWVLRVLSRGLQAVLLNLRLLHGHSTAMPSTHERLANFHETLDLERSEGRA